MAPAQMITLEGSVVHMPTGTGAGRVGGSEGPSSGDADAMRVQAYKSLLSEYYTRRLKAGSDEAFLAKIENLTSHPELVAAFTEVRQGGVDKAGSVMADKALMTQVSKAMGGTPQDEWLAMKLDEITRTPLTVAEAAKTGKLSTVETFVGNGAELNAPDSQGITALGYAVHGGDVELINTLLMSNADASAVDAKGNTALHYAAGYGHDKVVKMLVKGRRVDAAAKNEDGQTAADIARMTKQNGPMFDFL